jgi:hypothetical protein
MDGDIRDSRLRFYFRSGNSHPSPRQSLTAANIAAQCPDRLSVSLHKGTRRIIVPATNLSSVTINRAERYVKVEGDGWAAVLPRLYGINSSLRRYVMISMKRDPRQVKIVGAVINSFLPKSTQQKVNGQLTKRWKSG